MVQYKMSMLSEYYHITNDIDKEIFSRINELYLYFDRQEICYGKQWKRTLNFYLNNEFEFTLEIYFNSCIQDNKKYDFWVKKLNPEKSIFDSDNKIQLCTYDNKEKSLLHNLFKVISKEFNDFKQDREKTIHFMNNNNKMFKCKIYMDEKMITQVWNTYKYKNDNFYFTHKTSKIGA